MESLDTPESDHVASHEELHGIDHATVFNAPIMAISSMQPNSSHSINEASGLLHSINTQRHTTFGDGSTLTQTLRLPATLGLPWSTTSSLLPPNQGLLLDSWVPPA